jgi:fructoselysine-6-P-deglycase FrlB-like protein
MPPASILSSVQYHCVYVVCTRLSQRLSLYKSDARGHDPKQPPGITVQPGSLSPLHP